MQTSEKDNESKTNLRSKNRATASSDTFLPDSEVLQTTTSSKSTVTVANEKKIVGLVELPNVEDEVQSSTNKLNCSGQVSTFRSNQYKLPDHARTEEVGIRPKISNITIESSNTSILHQRSQIQAFSSLAAENLVSSSTSKNHLFSDNSSQSQNIFRQSTKTAGNPLSGDEKTTPNLVSKSFLMTDSRFSIGSGSSLAELTGSKDTNPARRQYYSIETSELLSPTTNNVLTQQGPNISSLSPSTRMALLPIHSIGRPISSTVSETQSRSFSIPRGPPPPLPYGMGRNHSWPSESQVMPFGPFRDSLRFTGGVPGFLNSSLCGPRVKGIRQPQQLRISKWVNPIPPDPDDGQQQTGEQELATKMLQIQSKRFYIDVKQNRRGRFMKVAEIGADGRRNQVFMALSTAAEFRDHLSIFSEFYSNLGPPNPDTLPEDGKLKSESMVKDNRRYYLDLKENSRGRFLRVSQTIARGGPRCQIAIPAQGMIEFRDALQELLDEFGTDDGGYKGELPEGRHMRVENKNFYFDIGQNNRGIYMRISEVKTNFRTAITIPEKSWSRFRDIFSDYVDKMKDGGGGEKSSINESTK